jgi:hypothetical protein
MTQVPFAKTVTVMPLEIVTGPIDISLYKFALALDAVPPTVYELVIVLELPNLGIPVAVILSPARN